MFSVSEHGSLAVAWTAKPRNQIERELRRIDERLFLDPERDRDRVYWTVKFWNGDRAPEPVTLVVDWRDNAGLPKDLSEGILHEVKRLQAQGGVSVESIARRNRELQAKRADESQGQYEEVGRDFDRHRSVGNFMLVPRSRGLQLTRAKMRARGIKT